MEEGFEIITLTVLDSIVSKLGYPSKQANVHIDWNDIHRCGSNTAVPY